MAIDEREGVKLVNIKQKTFWRLCKATFREAGFVICCWLFDGWLSVLLST
jgi:hypothetical protein